MSVECVLALTYDAATAHSLDDDDSIGVDDVNISFGPVSTFQVAHCKYFCRALTGIGARDWADAICDNASSVDRHGLCFVEVKCSTNRSLMRNVSVLGTDFACQSQRMFFRACGSSVAATGQTCWRTLDDGRNSRASAKFRRKNSAANNSHGHGKGNGNVNNNIDTALSSPGGLANSGRSSAAAAAASAAGGGSPTSGSETAELLNERVKDFDRRLEQARSDIPSFKEFQKIYTQSKPRQRNYYDWERLSEEEQERFKAFVVHGVTREGEATYISQKEYQKARKNRKQLLKQEKGVRRTLKTQQMKDARSQQQENASSRQRAIGEVRRRSVQQEAACRNDSLRSLFSRKQTGCRAFLEVVGDLVWRMIFDFVDIRTISSVLPRVCKHWRALRPVFFAYSCQRRGWDLPSDCTWEEVFVCRYQAKSRVERVTLLREQALERVLPNFAVHCFTVQISTSRDSDGEGDASEDTEEIAAAAAAEWKGNTTSDGEIIERLNRTYRNLSQAEGPNIDGFIPLMPFHTNEDSARCFVGFFLSANEREGLLTPLTGNGFNAQAHARFIKAMGSP